MNNFRSAAAALQPDLMHVVHKKKPGCRLVCKQIHCGCQSTVQMVRRGFRQLFAGQAGNAKCQDSSVLTASEEYAVCDRPKAIGVTLLSFSQYMQYLKSQAFIALQ